MKTLKAGKTIFKICDCHYELVSNRTWYFDGRYIKRDVYDKGKRVERLYLHKLVAETPKKLSTDHINGDKLDNQCSNLRICTPRQNSYNAKRLNKTGYTGVSYMKFGARQKRWRAYIADGKSRSLGYYYTAVEAAKAYNEEAKKCYGEYARLNDV